jgi:hypothetical protein
MGFAASKAAFDQGQLVLITAAAVLPLALVNGSKLPEQTGHLGVALGLEFSA